jgi:hypothetical protein
MDKSQTLQEIKYLFENGDFIVNYNGEMINEFSDENETLYFENTGEEISYKDLVLANFNIFEIIEEYSLEADIRRIIRELAMCKKDFSKYERGENCFIIYEPDSQIIFTEETIDELYDLDYLARKVYDIKVLKLKIKR